MRLNAKEVLEVLNLLDKGYKNSQEIADKLHIRKMQVAGVKAHRTMGRY